MTSHLRKLPIKHKNFILEDTRILQIQCFFAKTKYICEFFQSETNSKLYVPIRFEQVGISSGK